MIGHYTIEQIEAFRRTGYIVTVLNTVRATVPDENYAMSIAPAQPHLYTCRIEELLPMPPTPTPAPPTELDQLIALMPPIPDPNSNPEV